MAPSTIAPVAMGRQNAKTVFGIRLRMLRKARKMTLEELGRAASLGYKHIGDLERGDKTASFDAIDRLAHALNVPLHELFVPVDDSAGSISRSLKHGVAQVEDQSSPAFKRFVAEGLLLLRRLEAEVAAEARKRGG